MLDKIVSRLENVVSRITSYNAVYRDGSYCFYHLYFGVEARRSKPPVRVAEKRTEWGAINGAACTFLRVVDQVSAARFLIDTGVTVSTVSLTLYGPHEKLAYDLLLLQWDSYRSLRHQDLTLTSHNVHLPFVIPNVGLS